MRWALWILAIAALVGSAAWAGESDLEGGVFIAHSVAALTYTDAPEGGWCGQYTANAITSCEQQVTGITSSPEEKKIWYVIAAWAENKVWAGVRFGLSYSADQYGILAGSYGPCRPGDGLVIESPGWPAPGTGVSVVTTGGEASAWSGNFLPVYYFWGYTYEAGQVQITVDPSAIPPFAGVSGLDFVDVPFEEANLGAIGLNGTAGKAVCPGPTSGACCFEGGNECQLLSEADCMAAGGTFHGVGTVCDPNPCPTIWACCIGQTCIATTHDDCRDAYAGCWVEGQLCGGAGFCDAPCNTCCVDQTTCLILTEAECLAMNGDYVTDPLYQDCSANPCPVATERTTWGTIKAIYR